MNKTIVKTKEGWISIADAVEMLGISRMSLYKFIEQGKIIAQKQVNNQRLINKESVENFIKERLSRE